MLDLNGDGKIDAEDFRIAAERAHLRGENMSAFWYKMPILNLVYGLMDGDRPPSQENLKAVLNGYALVDALLLTIVMSMPQAMSFEEIELARRRFDGVVHFEFTDEADYDRRYDDWNWASSGPTNGRQIVTVYARWTMAAAIFLGCSLAAVFMVLGLCDLVLSEVHHLHRVNRAWWGYMRYVLLTIILFTMLGSVASMYAFAYTIYFRWPDYYVESHGRPSMFSPYGFRNWFAYAVVLPLFVVICLLSAATRCAFDAMQGDLDGDGIVGEHDRQMAAPDASAKVGAEAPRWYHVDGEDRRPYADDVCHLLEAAYSNYSQGQGASFPTVAVGGDCEVHLKTMQQTYSKTGMSRGVVRE